MINEEKNKDKKGQGEEGEKGRKKGTKVETEARKMRRKGEREMEQRKAMTVKNWLRKRVTNIV